MMFLWQPPKIRFMKDASENSSYYNALAQKIARHIEASAHVCDAGCGFGYLSVELSALCRRVSAVDIAPQALAVLKNNIARLHCGNISVIQGDITACAPDRHYDAMIFCFFGHTEEILRIAKKQCTGKVIIITRNWYKHRFTLAEKPQNNETLFKVQETLQKRRIRFASEEFALEMGQPLRSIADAVEFFRIYNRGDAPIREEDIIGRLIRQSSEAFPYYLPCQKQIGMVVLDSRDIPAAI
jgi:precorrin-6B methylase 2